MTKTLALNSTSSFSLSPYVSVFPRLPFVMMGNIYSSLMGDPQTIPEYMAAGSIEPLHVFPEGRKERGKFGQCLHVWGLILLRNY